MKKFFKIIGIALSILSLLSLIQYVFDYNILSEYGKGYLWGKVILLFSGLLLVYFGFRNKQLKKE